MRTGFLVVCMSYVGGRHACASPARDGQRCSRQPHELGWRYLVVLVPVSQRGWYERQGDAQLACDRVRKRRLRRRMRGETVEIYSDKTTAAVLHPGRRFPGALVRSETLYSLCLRGLVGMDAIGRMPNGDMQAADHARA
jgi:hypothetical protein